MSLPEPDGTIGEAHSGRVREVDRTEGKVEKEEKMGEWRTRHLRDRQKGKRDVGVEKEREIEEQTKEKMENFFSSIYKF